MTSGACGKTEGITSMRILGAGRMSLQNARLLHQLIRALVYLLNSFGQNRSRE